MNLSNLVHAGRRPSDQPFSHNPKGEAMTSSLIVNPYNTQHLPQISPYTSITAPQPPPSPPIDESTKCSLPSISSLLGIADGSSPREQTQQSHRQVSPQSGNLRIGSDHQYGPSPALSHRGALPPTPPMHSDSSSDGRQSPSAASISGYSVVSAPGYYFASCNPVSAINNVDPNSQRQSSSVIPRRVPMPATSMFPDPNYNVSPGQQSMSGAYDSSPMQPTPPSQVSGLFYQRQLPQFSPSLMPVQITLTPSSGANPWQHHHYISPSSAAAFPQSQDRYICQTCNKAFSRPSSLRIHSHSHTGEKPFKCPHQGCGKAFSVRSNMKRHERGCHTFEGGMIH